MEKIIGYSFLYSFSVTLIYYMLISEEREINFAVPVPKKCNFSRIEIKWSLRFKIGKI